MAEPAGKAPAGRDWSGGYPVKQSYSSSIQPQMAPRNLALVLLARNLHPPPFEGGFRYAELGCGTGVTLAALAAVNPEAEFLGIDFMPGHIAAARRLAQDAGLHNVRFQEADFAALAGADTPGGRFDYVALHGVYTWVSPENRRNIVRILDRWAAPGGVVYVGYNAMPGWLQYEPLRRIMNDMLGEAQDAAALSRAREAVQSWLPVFDSDALNKFWKRVSGLSDRYLIHEFAGDHGGALWSRDVATQLAEAKLTYCGAANLAENFDALLFPESILEKLRGADREGFGATARDILLGRSFRSDVFVRGAVGLGEAETARRLSESSVTPWPPLLRTEAAEAQDVKLRALGAKHAAALEAAMGGSEKPVAEVVGALGGDERKALQTVLVALARGDLAAVRPPALADAAGPGARRFNRVAEQRFRDKVRLPGLASPRLGTGIPVAATDIEAALSGGTSKAARTARAGLERLGIELGGRD